MCDICECGLAELENKIPPLQLLWQFEETALKQARLRQDIESTDVNGNM